MAYQYIKTAIIEESRTLKKIQSRNTRVFRQQPLQEISGSFGDLGTLLPILIALASKSRTSDYGPISVSSTLVFSGLANIFTGIMFGIPLPVQPMKAIAAVAIAQNFNRGQMTSAGLLVAATIGFLSITGLLQWFTKRIPIPIVKGIQLGTGLSLMISGGPLTIMDVDWNIAIRITVLVVTLILLLYCQTHPRVPYVLIILVIHLVVLIPALSFSHKYEYTPHFTLWKPDFYGPSPAEFKVGALNAGLGQIPLTLLNSVVAVTYLSADLLPDVPTPSSTSIGTSVAIINLIGCWFGAMPVCHGSGGLAAQYRFGARSGSSVIFLGLIKLIIGLFAVEHTLAFFNEFPKIQLGILLFIAGLELAKVGESLNTEGARDFWVSDDTDLDNVESKKLRNVSDEEKKRRWLVMMVTVGALLAAKNDGIGFLAGLLLHTTYEIHERWELKKSAREGRIRLGGQSDERAAILATAEP
ncbi:hypothetical protein MMC14_009495 [Varicellaria rhodocarpa]|nr:hypothetical protein [Varicellaria rhodocarpa]